MVYNNTAVISVPDDNRLNRAVFSSNFAAAGIITCFRVDYHGFACFFIKMENCLANLNAVAAANASFFINFNVHFKISPLSRLLQEVETLTHGVLSGQNFCL